MRVIDIVPKDISIIVELSVSDLDSLIYCLDNSVVDYDAANGEQVNAVTYYTDVFYPLLTDIKKRLNNVD